MYLSQLKLNPRHQSARRDLASPYEMHRTLARAYAPAADAAVARFLWRLEAEHDGSEPAVLMQAATAPDWAAMQLSEGYLVRQPALKEVDLDRLVRMGRTLRFRLRANPVVTREGKRHALHAASDQLAWLQRQGARLGFDVDAAVVSGGEQHSMGAGRHTARIVVKSAQFDGTLTVTDTQQLRSALVQGIGHGKAFGLGLLSVAPTE